MNTQQELTLTLNALICFALSLKSLSSDLPASDLTISYCFLDINTTDRRAKSYHPVLLLPNKLHNKAHTVETEEFLP